MTQNSNCRLCMKDTKEYILIFDDEMETEISQLLKLFQLMITPDPYKSNISCMTCYLKLVNFRKFHESCIGSEKLWNKLKRFDIKVEKICEEDLCDDFDNDFIAMEISKEEEELVESLTTKSDEQTNEEFTNVINVIEEQKLYECDHCGKKFETKDSMRDHMGLHQLTNSHTRKQTKVGKKTSSYVKDDQTGHECNICQRKFTTKNNLKYHKNSHAPNNYTTEDYKRLIKKNEEENLYECGICHRKYERKDSAYRHMRVDHPKNTDTGKELIDDMMTVKDHKKRKIKIKNEQIRFECDFCHGTFCNKSNLKVHMKRRHTSNYHTTEKLKCLIKKNEKENLYECGICQRKYKRKDSAYRHMRTDHPDHPIEGPPKPLMTVVQKKIQKTKMTKDEASLEQKEEENKRIQETFDLKCSKCDFVGQTFEEYKSHLKRNHQEHEPGLVCCGKKLRWRTHVIDHINFHRNPEKLQCKFCSRVYSESINLRNHINQMHASSDKVANYICEPCGKQFVKLGSLRSHMFIHLSDETRNSMRVYNCAVCDSRFLHQKSLKKHIRVIHLHQKFMCSDCGKLYNKKYHYEIHRKKVHGGEGPSRMRPKKQCPTCKEWYTNSSTLTKHISRMHTETLRTLTCDICEKKFFCKHDITKHMLRTHKERAFKCNYCPKAFPTATRLKEHIAMHTGVPLYTCPYCSNKDFNRRVNMYKHFKVMHPKEYGRDKVRKEEDLNRQKFTSKYKKN